MLQSQRRRISLRLGVGGWAMLWLTLASIVLCQIGAGLVAYALFLPAALILGYRCAKRSLPELLIFVLWLWTIGPGLRRYVELYAGFRPQSLILATIPALTLASAFYVLTAEKRSAWTWTPLLPIATVAVFYGATVGFVSQEASSVIASLLQWVAPLAAGLIIYCFTGTELREFRQAFQKFALLAIIVLSAYGFIQLILVPAWDVAWLNSVSSLAKSFGDPEPFKVRVYSLSNSPGPFAVYLVFLMTVVVVSQINPVVKTVSLGAATATLAMTEVRTAWLLLALVVVVLIARRALRLRDVTVFVLTFVLLFWTLGGQIRDNFIERLNTAQDPANDVSLLARVSFQVQLLPSVLTDPFGAGLGSTGAGARVSTGAVYSQLSSTDSGYLDTLISFGLLIGAILLVLTVRECLRHWRLVESPDPESQGYDDLHLAASAYLAFFPIMLLLGSTLNSLSGFTFWVTVAYCAQARLGFFDKSSFGRDSKESISA